MIAPNARILWLPGAEDRHWDFESGSFGGRGNAAGVRIDPETALRSTVVLACVRVLASSVAGLPLHLYRRLPNGGKELARENALYRVLHDTPNSWQTSYEWREQMMLHLLTHGQAFVEISGAGPQTQLIVLHPSRMKVDRVENGRLRYTYREASGSSTVYAQDSIMHLRWLSDDGVNGLVPVDIAKDAIGLARALEIHGASFFGNGARPGVVLTTDQMLSPEAAENTRNQWERAHRGPDRAHRTAVLQGGLKIAELGKNNQEAQYLEARRFAVEEICRIYGCPPHLVADLTRSSYSNVEQQSLDFLAHGLTPWLRRIESAISRDLISDDDLFAEFDVRGFLRADAAARASYFQTLWNLGVASVNEIRAWENLNPVEGGDTRFVQLNMTTLEKAAAESEAPVGAAPAPVDVAPEPTAEVSGLLAILQAVATGVLDKSGAAAAVAAAFPSVPPDQIGAMLDGVAQKKPAEEPPPVPAVPPVAPVSRSLPESRALTLSIDFDRTFAADPQLWGEFARQAVADGNTVVMISRRPEEDRATVMETLGDYADAFSQVLLVGGDTLKDDAAKAAGIDVDVWVDDSPQTVKPPMDCGCDSQRAFCPTGPGGGKNNSCGKGGGGGGSSGGGSGGKSSSAQSVLKGSGSGRGYLEKARVETSKAIDEIHSLPSGIREVQIKKASGATTVGSYSPSEGIIKVSDKGSHPLMTTAHEFGHYIDHHVFGGGKDGKNIFGTDGEAGTDQELKSFLSACRESKAYKQIDAVRRLDSSAAPYGINSDVEKALRGWGEKNRYGAYLQRPKELWARAYAQYVAERSSSTAMKKELQSEIDSAIRPERPSVTIPWTRHWEPDDFAPIASAIDRVLESKGLRKKK